LNHKGRGGEREGVHKNECVRHRILNLSALKAQRVFVAFVALLLKYQRIRDEHSWSANCNVNYVTLVGSG